MPFNKNKKARSKNRSELFLKTFMQLVLLEARHPFFCGSDN